MAHEKDIGKYLHECTQAQFVPILVFTVYSKVHAAMLELLSEDSSFKYIFRQLFTSTLG